MTKSRSDGPGSGSGAKPVTVSRGRRHSRHSLPEPSLEPTDEEIQRTEAIAAELGELVGFESDASKSWYYPGDQDLLIVPDDGTGPQRGKPLSTYCTIVRDMRPVAQRRIYVKPSDREAARAKIEVWKIMERLKGE